MKSSTELVFFTSKGQCPFAASDKLTETSVHHNALHLTNKLNICIHLIHGGRLIKIEQTVMGLRFLNPQSSVHWTTAIDLDVFLSANGQWNQWGHWSGCSKSCDGGWERRMRTCQGVAVTGQLCEGTGEEVRRCSEQRCPGE